MGLLVHLLHVTGGDTVLDEPAEVLLVSLLVLLLEAGHVVGHVETEDVLSVNISVEFLALRVIAREALLRVRNIQTTINSSLQSSKDLGSSGGPGETNIKTSSECSWSRVLVLHAEHAAVNNSFRASMASFLSLNTSGLGTGVVSTL